MTVEALVEHERVSEALPSGSSEPFPPLRPLPPPHPEAPELPEDLLPQVLRPWLSDVSERMQVALELVAVPALVALSAVVGRQRRIYPKAEDDWLVVPNLWGGIVARPGQMKSPALAETLQPVRRLVTEAQQRQRAAEDVSGARLDSLKAKELAIKEMLKKSHLGRGGGRSSEELEQDLVQLRREIREEGQAAAERRYIVNDPTVEKLGELLAVNPWGLLLVRDELAGWLRTLEREDRRGDREFFLEAWNGTNPFTYDRIGRGTIHVPALCLSIVGGIQPTKLSRLVSEAVEGEYAADGLLQRFQLLVWPEDRAEWTLIDRQPDLTAREQAIGVFRRLSQLSGPGDGEPVPALHFAPDAQQLFYAWLSELEHRLRSDEMRDAPAFESHLAKYRSLMPSLALLLHLTEVEGTEQPVSLTAAECAADWCEFLEQHARKLYAPELRNGRVAAHALAEKIRRGAVVSGMTIREIYNCGWSRLKTHESVLEGMAVLADHGWARVENLRTGKSGGRPKTIIVVNPEAREASG